MDNLTHSLTGALLARTGLSRWTPHATLLCIVAANAPDLDLFAGLTPERYLVYHRHVTHSLFAIPLMAAAAAVLTQALAWLWRRVRGHVAPARRFSFWRAWAVALIPAASHPILDLTNAYGVRLWLPVSGQWSSWDVLFVIDLVVWAILIGALAAAPLWAVLRGAQWPRLRMASAWIGLLLFASYTGGNAVLRERVDAALQAQTYEGLPPLETAAFPAPPTPFDWLGYVRTERFELAVPVDARNPGQLDFSAALKYEPLEDQTVDAAWDTRLGRAYRQFAQYPFTVLEQGEEGAQVILSDFRFFRDGQVRFACVIRLDASLRVVAERFGF
jgi:inner membrane protein